MEDDSRESILDGEVPARPEVADVARPNRVVEQRCHLDSERHPNRAQDGLDEETKGAEDAESDDGAVAYVGVTPGLDLGPDGGRRDGVCGCNFGSVLSWRCSAIGSLRSNEQQKMGLTQKRVDHHVLCEAETEDFEVLPSWVSRRRRLVNERENLADSASWPGERGQV